MQEKSLVLRFISGGLVALYTSQSLPCESVSFFVNLASEFECWQAAFLSAGSESIECGSKLCGIHRFFTFRSVNSNAVDD